MTDIFPNSNPFPNCFKPVNKTSQKCPLHSIRLANTIVGNLTKVDFAYPGGCTRQCHALEKDFAFKHHHRMGKII